VAVQGEGLRGFAAGKAEGGLEGEEGGGTGGADALGQMRVEIERGQGSSRGFTRTDKVGWRYEELVSRAGQAEDAAAGTAVMLAAGERRKGRQPWQWTASMSWIHRWVGDAADIGGGGGSGGGSCMWPSKLWLCCVV